MQEYTKKSDPVGNFAALAVALLFGYGALVEFAHWAGTDVNAALSIMIGQVTSVGLIATGVWSQSTSTWPLTVNNVLPLSMATLVMAFSPALNQRGCTGPLQFCWEMKWWGMTSLHYGAAFAFLIIGYGYLYLNRNRY